jgi:hypothetical protein
MNERMDEKEYSPLDGYRYAINNWWLIFGLIIIGGVIGMLFHPLRPPLYETKAVFAIHIDFNQSGWLSEFEQDYAINTARYLMHSDPVVGRVEEELARRNIPPQTAVLGTNVFFERKQPIIEIKVRNSDPDTAAIIANIWAEQAFIELKSAHMHAVQAESLWIYLKGLEYCKLEGAHSQVGDLCSFHTFEEIKREIETVAHRLQEEVGLSRGVIPALVFDLLQTATVPELPTAFGRHFLVLGGALAGFFAGAFFSSIRVKRK